MNQTIERSERLRKNAEKIDRLFINEIPDDPDPPKVDTSLCPTCKEPLRKNRTHGMLTGAIGDDTFPEIDGAFTECPLCGCNPY